MDRIKESFIALPSIIKYYHLQYCTAASTQPLLRSMDQACELSALVLGSTASDERSAHWSLHGRRAPLHSPSPCHRTGIQRRVIVCPVCLALVCITFNHIIIIFIIILIITIITNSNIIKPKIISLLTISLATIQFVILP